MAGGLQAATRCGKALGVVHTMHAGPRPVTLLALNELGYFLCIAAHTPSMRIISRKFAAVGPHKQCGLYTAHHTAGITLRKSLYTSLRTTLRNTLRTSLLTTLRTSLRTTLRTTLRTSLQITLRTALRTSMRTTLRTADHGWQLGQSL